MQLKTQSFSTQIVIALIALSDCYPISTHTKPMSTSEHKFFGASIEELHHEGKGGLVNQRHVGDFVVLHLQKMWL